MMRHRDRRPLGLPLVILQMALSATAFIIVLGTMTLVMPLWQLGKRLISFGRHQRTINENPVAPVLAFEHDGDIRTDERRVDQERKRAYYHFLLQLLTEEVQASFKEQHEPPTPRIAQLMQQLDPRNSV